MDLTRMAASWQRLIIDLLSITVLLTPVIVLRVAMRPVSRGFYCDDETIRYPFKENTVSPLHLIFVVILFPILMFAIIEKVRLNATKGCQEIDRKYWSQLYQQIVYYLIGFSISGTIMMVTKYTSGRLRPHFIAVCRPAIDCVANDYKYFDDYKCNNTDIEAVDEARQAFMSGHASSVCFAMIYLIFSIQIRINWNYLKHFEMVKIVTQLMLFLFAIFVSVSRVTDHWHHWQDVTVGAIQGSAIAMITIFFITDYRRKI
ncbi:lipid phosphate phosphohydrolase 1-like protein [Leptotrombidium deliense]|uniref:Lipid phosphate phosphohydrolase 1-like protein n=1 Tax=Leptotrombidium deliense TaxID=299467 RepID=A0A443SPN0_9ACAR|nr:lipid phosphate phosphohydrolase 1-like protein [Leptotrombidium deliense]